MTNKPNWLWGFLQGHLSAAVLAGIIITTGVFAGGMQAIAPEEYKPSTIFENTISPIFVPQNSGQPKPQYDENDNLLNAEYFDLDKPFSDTDHRDGDHAWKNFVVRFENATTLTQDGVRLYNVNTGEVADDRVWNTGDVITTHYELNDMGYWMTEYSVLNGIPHGFKVSELLANNNTESEQTPSSTFNKNVWTKATQDWTVKKDGVTLHGGAADDNRVWNTGDIITTHYVESGGLAFMTEYSYNNNIGNYFKVEDLEYNADNVWHAPTPDMTNTFNENSWVKDIRNWQIKNDGTQLYGTAADKSKTWNVGDIITTHYVENGGLAFMTEYSYNNKIDSFFILDDLEPVQDNTSNNNTSPDWTSFLNPWNNTVTINSNNVRLYNVLTDEIVGDQVWNIGDTITTAYELNESGYFVTQYSADNGIPHGFKSEELYRVDPIPSATNIDEIFEFAVPITPKNMYIATDGTHLYQIISVSETGLSMGLDELEDTNWNKNEQITVHYCINQCQLYMTQYSFENKIPNAFLNTDLSATPVE